MNETIIFGEIETVEVFCSRCGEFKRITNTETQMKGSIKTGEYRWKADYRGSGKRNLFLFTCDNCGSVLCQLRILKPLIKAKQ